MAAITRILIGSVQTLTSTVAIANNAYSAAADVFTITNTTNLALLADFSLSPTFAAAPVDGVIQLFAVDWSLDATPVAGPVPSATMRARLVGTFSPQPLASNALTTWKMSLNSIPLTAKTDYYLYNNTTGQSINIGWVLKAQSWSPGT